MKTYKKENSEVKFMKGGFGKLGFVLFFVALFLAVLSLVGHLEVISNG